MFKKSFLLFIILCFSVMSVATAADSTNANLLKEKEVLNKLTIVRADNDQIYGQKIKDMEVFLELKQKEFGASTLKLDNAEIKENLANLEHKLWLEAIEAVDKNMEKNGWKLVEQPESKADLRSTPGNLSITDRLYTYENNYYAFEGYWNWTNGTWDIYKNTLDIGAFRSLNKVDSILTSAISSWDFAGNSTNSYVSKRTETNNGVIFNIDDHYVKIPSGPAVFYTDSGKIAINFKDTGYNKFFFAYEHNYKKYLTDLTVKINGTKLTDSKLIVTYSAIPVLWQVESDGRRIN